MQVVRNFVTKTGPKGLKNRTVCLPVDLVFNSKPGDLLHITIGTMNSGVITFDLTGEELIQKVTLKRKEDRKFFVLHY